MGSVAQAVREFDEAVRVPWRPPLVSVPALTVIPGGAGASPGRVRASRAARAARLAPPAAGQSAGRRRAVPVGAPRAGGRTCARCGASGACEPAALRLTRRARRLLASLLAGGAVATAAWLGAGAAQDDGLRLAGEATTVVQPGDTLWSIARSVAGGSDVRDVVDEIQRLNGLAGTALVPGQVLELP